MPGPERFRVIRCSLCGLAFTYPLPADLSRHYPSGQGYASFRPGRLSPPERLRLAMTLRVAYGQISSSPPGRLLDVGCGAGDLTAAFARRGWRVFGIEPSEAAANVAASRGIEVHHGTPLDAPWPDGRFDAIIFNHSLEHIPEPRAALRRARGWLRSGGLIAITVPNFGSWQRRLLGSAWFQLDLPRHVVHFERATLSDVVKRAGLEPLELRTSSMLAGLPGSLQYAIRGRQVLSGRNFRLASWGMFPLALASQLVSEGDCLNLTCALRDVEGRGPTGYFNT